MRRALLIALCLISLLLVGLTGVFISADREVRVLDDTVRASVAGDYIALPSGTTHYALSGPVDGPVVLMLHGGTIPMWTWDAQVPALTAAGFRVLRYDQYGRGTSDRPAVDYDRSLYLTQLTELLSALGIDGPVRVVGLSFGGALTAAFAQAYPERVERALLIAPIVYYAEGKLLFNVAKVPGVGEWYARMLSVPSTVKRARAFFPDDQADALTARFVAQTTIAGFERSLLSYARGDALLDYRPAYAALADRPVLVLNGSDDHETPPAHVQFLEATFGDSVETVAGGGHGMHAVTPELVNARMVAFLTGD